MFAGVEPIDEIEDGFATEVGVTHEVDLFAVDLGGFGEGGAVHIVEPFLDGPAHQGAEVVLAAERDAGGQVGFEAGEVDYVLRFGEAGGEDVGAFAFGPATPVDGDGGGLDFEAAELAGIVDVLDAGKLGVEDVVVFMDEVGEAVANGDIVFLDAGDPASWRRRAMIICGEVFM